MMDLNALEASMVTELENDAAITGAFHTIRRGRPEGLLTDWFAGGELPALIVELKHPVRSGMATIGEKEHIIPALLWVVVRATTRETVRQRCQSLLPILDQWANAQMMDSSGLGFNVLPEPLDYGDVEILQQGDQFYGLARPGITIRAFEGL